MKRKTLWINVGYLLLAMLLALPVHAMAQQEGGEEAPVKLSQEELAQLLAPIALYPDELVSQILMASTYPLEIVQADRWVKEKKDLKGDALAKELEKENWDPSVKSLVNFPSVLAMMSQKLDLTIKVGDAFLAQQKEVLDTIQLLRKKAHDAGNLKTTEQQQVIVEKETIIIQPADPQVVYVPSYSTTVVYGSWMYPSYPPYYYYPPPPPSYPAYHFAAGVAVGAAWGYAWGNCNWHGGDVDIDYNRNVNVNNNIDRSKYQNQVNAKGQGTWKHDPGHRKNVAYKDGATAQKFGQTPSRSAAASRESRGFGDGGGDRSRASAGTMDRGAGQRSGSGGAGVADRSRSAGGAGVADRSRSTGGGRDSAFSSMSGSSGKKERMASDRGFSSRSSSRGGSSMRGGGFGGGSRGGGGGRGGGGRR
ncbi:MAG: DUF3300 domain-containing protein [Desulfurivibrio sp.]|nr:MAG: DUF3300 domain-containing protein [Desulfurivibrio sp.]